jgi:diguanylate cyclase (GGDEF)-like protein/PAS domain S-box-containing protein
VAAIAILVAGLGLTTGMVVQAHQSATPTAAVRQGDRDGRRATDNRKARLRSPRERISRPDAPQAVPAPGLWPIALAGAGFSLLLAGLYWFLSGARRRALRLAREQTQELTRSEQRFRSLAAASPLGVFSLTAAGLCDYANERMCELTGCSPEQLRGLGLRNSYHPDDHAALRKAVTQGSSRAASLRLRLVLPDGDLRWVKTHAAPLCDGDTVIGWVGTVEDVTAEVAAQIVSQRLSAELTYQARHDPLTDLPNRLFFTEQITELLDDEAGVSVLFIDVDRFKVVNDGLGHATGDRLLTIVAQRLRAAIRPGDLPARFAGDEFVVGLTGVRDIDAATTEAQRLLAALHQTTLLDGHELALTVSIGVAAGVPGDTAQGLVARADSAMYEAKSRGKARVAAFDGSAAARRDSTLDLERELRLAIDEGQLRLRYQPIVSVHSGAIVGVESLVRWQHPERGLLGPDTFIPLAEESDLIIPLGTWVLREACAQLDRWRPLLHQGVPFSVTVNVSARQLGDPHFPAVVATAVRDYRINPASLCLEITESALLADTAAAEEALDSLRRIGVRIAVDDFGTGYSSLSHLRLLPIDMLKIDRSFVKEVGVNSDSTAIVGAVIRLAGALGLSCVAEGVEEREQLNWLGSMGCEMAQGYYFAMPEPPETVAKLLVAGSVLGSDTSMDALHQPLPAGQPHLA